MTPEQALAATTQALQDAQATVTHKLADRDNQIRHMVNNGVTMYRVAKLSGLSQTMIARIIKAGDDQ